MEARPQGQGRVGSCGVGWGAGQSKPSANGKHTFSPSLELPFLLQRGEVAGVQEGTGIQKQGTDFEPGAQPCHNSWLL